MSVGEVVQLHGFYVVVLVVHVPKGLVKLPAVYADDQAFVVGAAALFGDAYEKVGVAGGGDVGVFVVEGLG